jgi:heme o synthase
LSVTDVRPRTAGSVLKDLLSLSKPRLSLLVVLTAVTGMWMAPAQLGWLRAAAVLFFTAVVVGAANALNSFLERDLDALMHRTRNRPLPARRLAPATALYLAAVACLVALPALWVLANPLTALLAVLALVTYVLVYTPLKRTSSWALPVGAVPGALPPLMGWTAVTDSADLGGLALFAVLFFWQLPHFTAISIYLKEDYGRADLKVFARVHGDKRARFAIMAFSLVLLPVSLSVFAVGSADVAYAVVATCLSLGLFAWSLTGFQPADSTRWARNIFLGTIGYLSLLLTALALGVVRP